ncbi:MAG: peroxiredoxin family protein [Thermoanaerobaculales bacterium]|jgi:tetratricopeptide (TPR) repeat protein|nr:peroxiredoxin family protein [Thermoanaerobaculales bacterium]
MVRQASVLALTVLVGLTLGCSGTEQAESDPAAAAYEAFKTAWDEAATAEAKAALAADHLARFPDTDHSGSMAWRIAYYRGDELGDPAGAWAAIETALPRITDPEQRFEASMAAFSLADSVEVPLDIAEVADALAAVRPLSFDEHGEVADAALELAQWAVAEQHAGAALELATPEQVKADYPEREFSEAQLLARSQHRRASSLAARGWALFNIGERDAAFQGFEEAAAAGSVGYLGVPNTPLYRYWGRAALSEGDLEKAIELLGAEAIFGEDRAAAEPYLREAFAAKGAGSESYEEFLWATRNRLAKPADDFELPDYEGRPHRLSDRTGAVTLLAFWFPT